MSKIKVTEIFYSLQGEGYRAGRPSIFIRLAGCDRSCAFCDTEFESGAWMSFSELYAAIAKWPGKEIVWTGGEPMLQLGHKDGQAMVKEFKDLGYFQAIESNGSHPIPRDLFNWIAVSPKVAEHVLVKNFPDGVDELRYVRHVGQLAVPEPRIKARHYYLSPMFAGNQPDPENIAHCIRLALETPRWAVSIQLHKLLNIK